MPEEIFGPVLSIIPFENEEEAIKITNDTEYGLGNYLQTEDKEKAKEFQKIKIWVRKIINLQTWHSIWWL